MTSYPLTPAIGVVFLIVTLTTACDQGVYRDAVAKYGTACSSVVEQTKNAYRLVNDTVMQQEILALAARTSPIASDPSKFFHPFIAQEDLQVRFAMLDALDAYAEALGDITGKTDVRVDSEATKLGESLQELATNGRLQKSLREAKSISRDDINGAATALDAIGKFLVNRKLSAQLPSILSRLQPRIEAIASLLAREIGDVPGSADPGGLREKLARTYDSLIENQAKLVDADRAGSPEKRDDVARLSALVLAQRNGDAALLKTRAALDQLVHANKALAEFGRTPASFRIALASAVAQARNAEEFYSKIPTR